MCAYTDEHTSISFDATTGNFSFHSNDFPQFGVQTINYEITGYNADTSSSFLFSLDLVDPCQIATINIAPSIINTSLVYLLNAE